LSQDPDKRLLAWIGKMQRTDAGLSTSAGILSGSLGLVERRCLLPVFSMFLFFLHTQS
jgi:hypothetical protein